MKASMFKVLLYYNTMSDMMTAYVIPVSIKANIARITKPVYIIGSTFFL